MARFCKCGKVLQPGESCNLCFQQKTHAKTTKERGYGNDHKEASFRYRTLHPLCERCMMLGSVVGANVSVAMHHIVSIAANSSQRMDSFNWLAVCNSCHEAIEGRQIEGMAIKKWSIDNYEAKINEGLS